MTTLSTGDVLEIVDAVLAKYDYAGLTPKEFRGWAASGVVTPAAGGNGQGDHRMYSQMQAVGITYAALWQRSGAGSTWLRQVIDYVAAMSDTELSQLPAGSILVPLREGPQLARVERGLPGAMDLGRVYRDVLAATIKVARRLRRERREYGSGRLRGLAVET